jgi:hypothetical protein
MRFSGNDVFGLGTNAAPVALLLRVSARTATVVARKVLADECGPTVGGYRWRGMTIDIVVPLPSSLSTLTLPPSALTRP